MPFDHNDHYHRLISRQIPHRAGRALDVGCGTGAFAHRLAARGLTVEAVDPSAEMIAAARRRTPAERRTPVAGRPAVDGPRFRRADITRTELSPAGYDVITCLASLHHVPFAPTLGRLRDALAPGGVLVVLGCYAERTVTDHAWSLAALPVNATARVAVAAGERLRGVPSQPPAPPVRAPELSLAQVRGTAATLLPGARVRRLLLWRYLLVHHAPRVP
ncbi:MULTISPECIES: bifunctional 2-polyprenyl-6-hydroxyphenol methylase/3-demethylubiquinol 3-O-methyltransferase UbiG [unclassified Streptomyces]|uniref:class I SAM-dependent methyltransferase n=1 Tax=unclassified Streptomyces TaxID=2593676 RepID=UPI000CD51B17|nr:MULTISPECIES: class I SAM-dependent methyltransferase [unclassified Streptomyces]